MPRKSGITLIELLVVFAILGILIALLMPAIQRARESARRVRCMSHLHQLGLALHIYHNSHKAFPPGSVNEWSWNAKILPYLDQKNFHQQFNFKFDPFTEPNLSQLDYQIPMFLCPSDPYSGRIHTAKNIGGIRFAHTNYIGAAGGNVSSTRGMFPFNKSVQIEQVMDGTSQTLFAGERGIVTDGDQTFGWWAWGSETTIPLHSQFKVGSYWELESVYHWWSYHDGGSLFLFVDGSVRFFDYSLDSQTYLSMQTINGCDFIKSFE